MFGSNNIKFYLLTAVLVTAIMLAATAIRLAIFATGLAIFATVLVTAIILTAVLATGLATGLATAIRLATTLTRLLYIRIFRALEVRIHLIFRIPLRIQECGALLTRGKKHGRSTDR